MNAKAALRGSAALLYVAFNHSAALAEATSSQESDSAAGDTLAPDTAVAAGTAGQVQDETVEDSASLGGDIVVTARRREENLMEVPISVAVMGATEIQDTGIKTLQNLAQFTPGLYAASAGATPANNRSQIRVVFRGLSSSPGSVFIDGAPYAGSATPDIADVERVEVLKGPQSVYFGRATFSGAVNYVSRDPSNEFRGRVSADFSSYGGADGRLMVEGPVLGDALRARASVRRYTFDGQYRNGADANQRLGSESSTSASLALASSPAPNLDISAYYSYALDKDGPRESTGLIAVGPGPVLDCNLGGTGGPYWCGELPSLSELDPRNIGAYNEMDAYNRRELVENARGVTVPFDPSWNDRFGLKREAQNAHLKVDLSTDTGWEVGLLGSWSRTKTDIIRSAESRDLSHIANPFALSGAALDAACAAPAGSAANNACFRPPTVRLALHNMTLVNDASAEVRISSPQDRRLRGTLGGSYYTVWGPLAANFGVQNGGRVLGGGGGGLKTGVKTSAIFGGLYFDITDRLKLSAEGRYQWDRISQQQIVPTVQPELEETFPSFSPRVTLDYQITPDMLAYATFSRGYRPGGFNAILLGQPQSVLDQLSAIGTNLTFDQERIDNFEIGHKATWFDNRLRTTVAVYYMSYTDGQIANAQFITNPNGSSGNISVTQNVGKIELKGVELEADLAVTRDLGLSATFGYADNKLVNYIYAAQGLRIRNSTNVVGNQTDQNPKIQFTLSPHYKRDIANGWELFTRLDWQYRSKIFVDPTNVAWIGARSLVNFHLGFRNDNAFRIEGYVNNLFNDDTLLSATKSSESIYGPNSPCPPCFTAAAPPVIATGTNALNQIFIGLPVKRTVGVRASYEF